ncbi:MAG: hypothetical protein COU65_02005 [Candidatus Pacebacteria bacterium CG10_big_fil_rev_8_21_14_0_10_42_12]|nr:glycosyltransferase [Candidatus Paceibacterota bacterium]PIR62736.1 MAG: hypothetical protein COU65_02005 [Candidatus Pacebacteria bacterium CG10_big_fil_rev_8_21_14_0_10_42_12]
MTKTVLHLTRLAPPHGGGVEKHLQKIIVELSRLGFSSTIITTQHNKLLALEEETKDYRIVRLAVPNPDAIKHKLSIWTGLLKHFSLLKNADIIQIHDVFWWLLPFLPFLSKKKIYITFHGYENIDGPSKSQVFWHRTASKLTRGNLCIGGFHNLWYGVIPTALSFGAVNEKKVVAKKRRNSVIFVGQMRKDTGILEYLEAIKIFNDKSRRKISLEVYGDGPLESKARSFVNKYNLPVKFHGWKENASNKIGEFSFAFASQYLSILESLITRTPVIAIAPSKFKRDYLKTTPYAKEISIVRTPKAIAKTLLKPKEISPILQAWARKQTWKKMAETYIELWKK